MAKKENKKGQLRPRENLKIERKPKLLYYVKKIVTICFCIEKNYKITIFVEVPDQRKL